MKAFVHHRYGSPDVLSLAELPLPIPASRELRVRVHATTVNRTDCGFRLAEPALVRLFSGLLRPKFPVLGSEFSGVVESVGAEVRSFRVGDAVFGTTAERFGAHAEYLCVHEDAAVALKPQNLSHTEAASLSDGAYIALCYLRAGGVRQGTSLLINGGTGAIGSAAVQLAKVFGAQVTAVCDTARVELVRSLGADRVIDYTQLDFARTGALYEVIFDSVGKSSFSHCRPALTPQGLYLSTELGTGGQNPLLALATAWSSGRRVQFPIPRAESRDIRLIKELVEAGKYRSVIDRVVPFDSLVEATRYVELGHKTGNVVLQVCD